MTPSRPDRPREGPGPDRSKLSGGDGYLLDVDAGTYDLTRFDPETGADRDGGTVEGGASADLPTAPFDGDNAAILRR